MHEIEVCACTRRLSLLAEPLKLKFPRTTTSTEPEPSVVHAEGPSIETSPKPGVTRMSPLLAVRLKPRDPLVVRPPLVLSTTSEPARDRRWLGVAMAIFPVGESTIPDPESR